MTLITELKRRNVFKVGIAYVALGWMIIQITSLAVPALNLPEQLNSIVFYLGMIGFPFALFFAWAFELTPDGVKPTAEVNPNASITPKTGRKIDRSIIAILAVAILYLLFASNTQTPDETPAPASAKTQVSIAVLPFADMSADKNQEYFGDGIAEELLNVLVRIKSIRVPSRTSSFAFKEKPEMSAREIGTALQVDHVLEGSIRTSGNTVRITAQLIDVRTDTHLWSETYDRSLNDIFAIQDEISHAIVEALKVKLGAADETIVDTATTNMEAYKLYLQGLAAFGKRGGVNGQFVAQAISLFEQATKADPTYADAWAAYARTLALAENYGVLETSTELIMRARAATNMALLLEPDNADAITSSAIIKFQFEGDFDGADQDFKRAVALTPGNSTVYNFYGDFLSTMFSLERTQEIEGRAYQLDPNSVVNIAEYIGALIDAGYIEKAETLFKENISKFPDPTYILDRVQNGYWWAGMTAKRDATRKKLYPLVADNPLYILLPEIHSAYEGDLQALALVANTLHREHGLLADLYYANGIYDKAAEQLDTLSSKPINYALLPGFLLFNPRLPVTNEAVLKSLEHPKYKKLYEAQRAFAGLPLER